MQRTALCIAVFLSLSAPAAAQWPVRMPAGLPRSADGTGNLAAPPPRTSHGTPGLSGLWIPEPDPNGKPGGVENTVFARYLFDVTQDLKAGNDVLVPFAEATYRKRLATEGADDPIAHCQPPGSPRIFSLSRPTKIVETPGLVLLLHEHDTSYRQIFTDGRSLPEDPLPASVVYSLGRLAHHA